MSLQSQIDLLKKRLESAKDLGLSAAKSYVETLKRYGGVAPELPSEPSAFNLM